MKYSVNYVTVSITLVARSNTWVCGRWLVGSNLGEGVDVCPL
jgi:hypothetical protein